MYKLITTYLVVLATIFFSLAESVYAQITVPGFPSCPNLVSSGDGDWVHADSGEHKVPGMDERVRGSQNIYYRGGGNFVQCVCPVQGEGNQVWWWNANDLSQDQLTQFENQGWETAQGRDYGLMHYVYLIQKKSYLCNASVTASPTVSGTITPRPTSSLTAAPTSAVSATPTTNPQECQVPKPKAPTILSGTKKASDSAELVWSVPSGGADNYSLTYGTADNKRAQKIDKTGKTTSYRIKGLDLTKTYYFSVQSIRECAVSDWSNEFVLGNGQEVSTGTKGLADTASVGQIITTLVAAAVGVVTVFYGVQQASLKQKVSR